MSNLATSIEDNDPTPIGESKPFYELDQAPVTAPTAAPPSMMNTGALVPPAAADAMRLVLSRYEMSTGTELPTVIAVTSAVRGEGVTTLSRALASVLSTDLDTAVGWIDLSWPTTTPKKSNVPPPPGICEVLRGSLTVHDVMYADPAQPLLTIVPLGDPSLGDQSRLARSPQLTELIHDLSEHNQHIVIDAGAVLDGTEALSAVRQADAHLLVVRQGSTSRQQVQAAADELEFVPSLGALLNQYRTRTPAFFRNRLGR